MIGKRITETTVETREVLIIRRRAIWPPLMCRACAQGAQMLTTEEAARVAGVSQRTINQWVENGRIHFIETADGSLFVCLAPLYAEIA